MNGLLNALAGEPLPAALVDLEALEANVDTLCAPVRAAKKTVRVASKSLRSVPLLRRILERAGDTARGLMTYTAAETAFLAAAGFGDLLLAYPTALARDAEILARLNANGARAAVVVDCDAHLDVLVAAGRALHARVPVVIDVDVSWRPLGRGHVGVRRSPLREPPAIVQLARRATESPELSFAGLLTYEAQIAGVPDFTKGAPLRAAATRMMKRFSSEDVARARRDACAALAAAGLSPALVNAGGTGNAASCAAESCVTEVTIGSGFLDSHLFDRYETLRLRPAAFFALQAARRPGPNLVTCHGGGYVASGVAGEDRLPRPVYPEGARLLPLEGAGEVQTPLLLPPGTDLALGAPVLFRHAKAGELAEHFNEYLLVSAGRIVERAATYRGEGRCFLG
jgi:D-serine deaminase-like pyridoxal phosphate-dependent protein